MWDYDTKNNIWTYPKSKTDKRYRWMIYQGNGSWWVCGETFGYAQPIKTPDEGKSIVQLMLDGGI